MAELFWESAPHIKDQFPRDIESALAWATPLFIVRVPSLWVHDVEIYLQQRRLPTLSGAVDRPLHGCVFAVRGKGLVVVDGTDEPHELRFTIAHEVAHFLLDYQTPRLLALEKLGQRIEAVLDGQRPPTQEERVDGLLVNVSVGLYAHFMHRDDAGFGGDKILEVESQADRLAFELVAPESEVLRVLPRGFADRTYRQRLATLRRLLMRRYGLPSEMAQKYATTICRSRFGGMSVREWLGVT